MAEGYPSSSSDDIDDSQKGISVKRTWIGYIAHDHKNVRHVKLFIKFNIKSRIPKERI